MLFCPVEIELARTNPLQFSLIAEAAPSRLWSMMCRNRIARRPISDIRHSVCFGYRWAEKNVARRITCRPKDPRKKSATGVTGVTSFANDYVTPVLFRVSGRALLDEHDAGIGIFFMTNHETRLDVFGASVWLERPVWFSRRQARVPPWFSITFRGRRTRAAAASAGCDLGPGGAVSGIA